MVDVLKSLYEKFIFLLNLLANLVDFVHFHTC